MLLPETEKKGVTKGELVGRNRLGVSRWLDAFHVMAKPTGPICNLDCKYCFYLEKKSSTAARPNGPCQKACGELCPAIHRSAAGVGDQFRLARRRTHVAGSGFFRKAVALQKRYAGGKQITNAFQTNGVLLNDSWGEFLVENQFLVGLSVDGPRELHDRYRVSKGGQPTFDRVLRGIECLKKHRVVFNTLTVVHRYNADHPLEIYHFLKEIGSGFMQFIPIVERVARVPNRDGLVLVGPDAGGEPEVAPWSVKPLQYGRFLCEIFDEWVRRDVGQYFIQTFDVALESWLGVPQSLCVFRETCGEAMVMEHNGDVYSCDHYVYPEYHVGNTLQEPFSLLANSSRQQKFGQDKRDRLPRQCRECEVRFACTGECPKHRFLRTADGDAGLSYLCAGYKLFFRHIDPHMRFMAQELACARPPANVMQWVLHQEGHSTKATS